MTERCSGCYDSFSGPWCDNCDQWPCTCLDDELGCGGCYDIAHDELDERERCDRHAA